MNISIVMATYNGSRFIREQMDSILDQTELPYEIIVCDDGSSDETVSILDEYSTSSIVPIEILHNEGNMGSTLSFSKAISKAAGDVIVLCDQDDLWKSDRLEKIRNVFEQDDNITGVYSDAELIDESGKPLEKSLWKELSITNKEFSALKEGGISAFKVLLKRNVITGAAFAFKNRCIDTQAIFPKLWVHDAWIVINLVIKGRIGFVPECLVGYRQHSANQIGLGKKSIWARYKYRPAGYFSDLISRHKDLLAFLKYSEAEDSFIAIVEGKIRHLNARLDGEDKSAILILELFNGNYHRYSSGFLSFIKDFITSFYKP